MAKFTDEEWGVIENAYLSIVNNREAHYTYRDNMEGYVGSRKSYIESNAKNYFYKALMKCGLSYQPFKGDDGHKADMRALTAKKIHYHLFDEHIFRHLDDTEDDEPTNELPIETNEENEMSSTVAFETVNYVFGQKVDDMSKPQLMGAIKTIEGEIRDFKLIETKSEYIEKEIKSRQEAITKIVKLLDA